MIEPQSYLDGVLLGVIGMIGGAWVVLIGLAVWGAMLLAKRLRRWFRTMDDTHFPA